MLGTVHTACACYIQIMERADVVVIGGGPAGSTCAGRLRDGGLDVLVLDKAQFPRPKLCAGWITPAVLDELDLSASRYAEGRVLQPMTGFRIGRIGGPSLVVRYSQPVSFGIRRIELDDYLLRRSGARLHLGDPAKAIRRSGKQWIVNERFETPMLVAAGGHFCPVARLLGLAAGGHGPVIASQEIEFELSAAQQAACPVDPQVPELYFCEDLLGYGWCIRKGNYLNVGLGRADPRRLPAHVADFCRYLAREGRTAGPLPARFQGHAYLLYEQSSRPLLDDGVVWLGDAAGLAYPQSGEGIRPAIESGLLAADTILEAQGDYRRERLELYRRRLETRFGPRAAQSPGVPPPSALHRRLAGWLLGRRWFVRHILLERWFFHNHEPAIDLPCRNPAPGVR